MADDELEHIQGQELEAYIAGFRALAASHARPLRFLAALDCWMWARAMERTR